MNCTVDSEHSVIIGFAVLAHRTTSSEFEVGTKTTIIGSIQLYVSGCHRKPRRTAFPSSNVKCCTGSNTHILRLDGYLSRSRETTNTPDPLCFHITRAINGVERKNGNEYTSTSCQTPTNTGILTMSYLRRKSGCGSHPESGRMRGTPCVPVVPCSPGHSLPLSSGCKWNKCCLGHHTLRSFQREHMHMS